jgi:predicted dehydrogenase
MSTQSSRRAFIHGISRGLACVSILPVAASRLMAQQPKKLGFALVGLGNLSTNQIAPALQKTKFCRLAAVVTGTPAKERIWADKYKIPQRNIYNYDNFDQIAGNPEIDVVYVVLPNAMHGEFTIRAAKAGKHVLCEKPMEVSAEKCQAMIDVCKEAKVQLAVGYRCQFTPHHLELIRMAREKAFGQVKLIEASFGFRIGDPNQWRLKHSLAGGGALMDVGIYALQAARYVSGEEPIEISATETKTDPVKFREVDESIAWSMRFPSGVMANCATTYFVNGMNRIWAGAESGWFQLDPAYSYGGLKGRTSKGEIELPQVDHFAAEMDDFAECILNGKKSKVSGEEGLRDVKVMTAIYQSIKEGKAVKL